MLIQIKVICYFINNFLSRAKLFDDSTMFQQRMQQRLLNLFPCWHSKLFKHFAFVTHCCPVHFLLGALLTSRRLL